MTPQENLNDIMNKRILKTKMYSFNEVREMFELERQRLKEEIDELRHFYFLDGIRFLKKAEVLALLDNHEKSLSEGLSDTPQTSSKLPKTNLNGESRKGNRGLSKLKKVKVMEKK